MNALVLRMKVWLRKHLHNLRIRILGKNADEQAWEVLLPWVGQLARGANMPPEASPEELATGAITTLAQLVDHFDHLDEREQRLNHSLRLLVDHGLWPAAAARRGEGVNSLLQALLQQHISVSTLDADQEQALGFEQETQPYH